MKQKRMPKRNAKIKVKVLKNILRYKIYRKKRNHRKKPRRSFRRGLTKKFGF
jgi:hypothetical protein